MYTKPQHTRTLVTIIEVNGRAIRGRYFTDEVEAVKHAEKTPTVLRLEDTDNNIVWERE